jgi:AcrR family transcriptional regulator
VTVQRGTARVALMDAARRCLHRDGYAGTTARAVAGEAGANLRSIGYHYGSVRELALAALSANFRTWLGDLISPGASRRQLSTGLESFTRSYDEQAGMVAAWLEAVADPAARDRLAENQAGFRDRLAANLAAAGVAEPQAAAAALITVCDGLMIRHQLHGAAPTPATVVADAAAALRVLGR